MTDTSLLLLYGNCIIFGWSLCFYCLFSYPSLLELHYGLRIKKSQTAREWARETGLLVREAEWRIDTELFLNKYPRWELGAPHWSIILHEMFLHTAEWGQKEAERLLWQGCQGSASEPDLGVGLSAMELVGYQISCKEIWDIYHSVYFLRRSPGLLPCGAQQRGRVICNILSSLMSWLHRQGYPATTWEGRGSKNEWLPRLSRRESYEEALKVAHQRALETAYVSEVILRGWPEGWGTYHEPTPDVEAEAGAVAEVVTDVTVRVILEVALRVDSQGPLVGLNPEGRWLSGSQRLSWTPKGRKRITHQSLPFWVSKHG